MPARRGRAAEKSVSRPRAGATSRRAAPPAADAAPGPLRIRKYTNRRFYDATRSRHVTLPDLHDLICQGYDLSISDARSGEDITHQVLTQILLERDAPKLCIFPANILHQMIRTQQQLLGSVVEQFFQQALQTHRASQERWAEFVRNVFGAGQDLSTAPLDWTRAWMEALTPTAGAMPPPTPSREAELRDLRRQMAELTRRIESLSPGG